jgi:predicted ATPase
VSAHAIRLENFRGFIDAKIELKPLTVLLGPNSAGKSSFGHALAAMAHAHWLSATTGDQATLTPRSIISAEQWPVDLGETADLRTRGVDDRVRIELETADGSVTLGFGEVGELTDLRLSYIRHPAGVTRSTDLESAPVEFISAPDATTTAQGRVVELNLPESSDVIEVWRVNEQQWRDASEFDTRVGLEGLVLRTVQRAGGTAFELSYHAQRGLRTLFKNMAYLRGSRVRPARGYERGGRQRQQVGYSGEYVADVYLHRQDETIPNLRATHTGWSVKDAVRALDIPWTPTEETLRSAVGFWLNHLELAFEATATKSARDQNFAEMHVSLDNRSEPRDLTEVGFGVSQVLPVIVGGLIQPKDSLFIVDLPEAHLHPRPQAPLADFFCSLALSGRQSLVETHSEMFLHQLRLRASMHPELQDNIAVYFIDEPRSDGLCEVPRLIDLSDEGELRWPKGFLQEGWEIENQIMGVREARRSAIP